MMIESTATSQEPLRSTRAVSEPVTQVSRSVPRSTAGRRLIFVGGTPRSGTTLLQNMLDSHPRICGGPVFAMVPLVTKLRNELHQAIGAGWIEAFCTKLDVDRHIAELIERLLLPIADRHEAEYLSEKTTANILVFPELMEVLPAARFVCIFREPRAIAASVLRLRARFRNQKQQPPRYARSLSKAIEMMADRFRAGCRARKIAPERVHTVLYESLVADPKRETRAICDFLGIEWSADMLHPSRKEHPGEKTIANSLYYPSKELYYRDPAPPETDPWKTDLSAVQKARLAVALGGNAHLAEFGYQIPCTALDRLGSMMSVFSDFGERFIRRSVRKSGAFARSLRRRGRLPV